MSKTKRIVAIISATIILLSSLSLISCNSKKQDLKVVGTVKGYEVHYEELRWLTMQFKDRMEETYGEGIWDDESTAEQYRAELEEVVYKSIIGNYAVLTLCDDLNQNSSDGSKYIDINGETESGIIDEFINETVKECGSKAEYRQRLKENYMTENLYRFITGIDVCESILFNYYCNLGFVDDSNQTAIDYIYDNYIRTVHIFVENDKNESVEDNRQLINALYQKLQNGEDMTELIDKYGEDGKISADIGYYFDKGTWSKSYEDAAFALEVNEISEIIETNSGFYIIKRLELDDAYIAQNFLTGLKFKDMYLLDVFDEYIEERKNQLTFDLNEYGRSIDLVKMK